MRRLPFIMATTIILLNTKHCFAASAGYILSVKFFYDANANCVKDVTESYAVMPLLVLVDSNGVSVDTISATSGFYYFVNFACPPGTIYKFSLLTSAGSPIVTCPSSGFITDTISSSIYDYPDKYFGLACPTTSTFDLAEYAFVPVTGSKDQLGYIYVGNNSCSPVTGILTFNFSPKYMYGGAIPTPSSISGNTLTWNLSTLVANGNLDHIYYELYNPAIGILTAGDTVQEHITVTPISGDSNPANNSEIKIDTVKASCDPNEISVSPEGCIASGSGPVELKYMIRFENTGNDTAHNIYVMDTLSDYLDPGTLRIQMATNAMNIDKRMNIDIFTGNEQGIVKFDFPNIQLLDSTHHDKCDGAVIYTIKTLPGVPAGTHIYNYAGIYFDSNTVVMTNTADNATGCPTAIITPTANKTQLFPNPATDVLTIITQQNTYSSFIISNSMGQQLMQQPINTTQTEVDINALSPGLYYIALRGAEDVKVQKFVKI